MSDEFDKEAEKEKLRQQLAEEEADRQTTQRMSELLLKGATMTNQHCDQCGDPLFRHEGRTFCPTCGWEPGAAGRAGEAAGTDAVEQPSDAAGGEAAVDGGAAAQPPTGGPAAAGQPTASSAAGPATSPPAQGAPAAGEADLEAARQALARKVTALAREAEATTDVGRARELLAAVREGAEALRALDGSGR